MTDEIKKDNEEIIIIDKPADSGGEGDADAPAGDSEQVDELAIYKKKLEEAESRAAKAEKERDEKQIERDSAQTEQQKATLQAIKSHEDSVVNLVSAAKSEFASAQAEWDDAYDSGDKARLREANIKLNDAQARLRGAEFQKERFESWKEEQKKAPAAATATPTSRYSKGEQEWISKHPRFNTDRKYKATVYAADEEAKAKGYRPDTPEYYAHIENALIEEGLEGEQEKKPEPKKEEKKQSKASTAAPASSSSSSSPNGTGGKRTFHMTPEHREAAAVCYPELYRKDPRKAEEQYAARQLELAELKKQGRM